MLAHFEIVAAFTDSRTDICVDGGCASGLFWLCVFLVGSDLTARNAAFLDGRRLSLPRLPTLEPPRAKFHVFIHPQGTKSPLVEFRRRAYDGGCIMLSRHYFVSQVASLLKFAKETTNPQLAAVLIEKAADLKFQVDESSTMPEPRTQAPDAQPEMNGRCLSPNHRAFNSGWVSVLRGRSSPMG